MRTSSAKVALRWQANDQLLLRGSWAQSFRIPSGQSGHGLLAGIRNLFEKQPPIAMSAFANSFLPPFYRMPGRFLYGNVGVRL